MEKSDGRILALATYLMVDLKSQNDGAADAIDVLAAIHKFTRSPIFAREAAMHLKPTLWSKVCFPRSYFLFRKAKIKLEGGFQSVSEEREWTEILIKSAARLQFGVPVNAKWYGTLLVMSQQKGISAKKLSRLLATSTIYWSKDGDLLVKQHHWSTKILLTSFIVLMIALGIIGFIGLLSTSRAPFWQTVLVAVALFSVTWLPIFAASWYMGPFSWRAAKRLDSLIQEK